MIEYITAYNPVCGFKAVHYKYDINMEIWEAFETSKCVFRTMEEAETYALGWATKTNINYIPHNIYPTYSLDETIAHTLDNDCAMP